MRRLSRGRVLLLAAVCVSPLVALTTTKEAWENDAVGLIVVFAACVCCVLPMCRHRHGIDTVRDSGQVKLWLVQLSEPASGRKQTRYRIYRNFLYQEHLSSCISRWILLKVQCCDVLRRRLIACDHCKVFESACWCHDDNKLCCCLAWINWESLGYGDVRSIQVVWSLCH